MKAMMMAKAKVAAAVLAGMTVAVLALGGIPGFGGEPAPEAPHPGGEVLGTGSYLRVLLVGAPDQIRRDSGDVEAVAAGHADKAYKQKMRHSAFPSPDWRSPDFNDLFWPRRLSPVETSRERTSSLLCARGRFLVGDPGKADLTLSLSFRGGTVVYMNGKEVARAHMPALSPSNGSQGAVHPDTPAEPYPKEAWVDPDGFVLRNAWGDPEKYPDRFKLRERRIENLKIPAEALRRGVNVLAIEIHRPYTDVAFYDGKPRQWAKSYCQWSTLALDGLKLTAPAGASVAGAGSNVRGFRVWNRDTSSWVADSDWPDAGEALRPIDIRGARNGGFSAQVVAGSGGAIRGLKAVAGDLKGGKGTIPAARVHVRYALFDGPSVFDGLEESPPAEVPVGKAGRAVQPIWVTVNVPADAPAGEYEGRLTVEAQGAEPVEVPVKLSVADWTIPEVTESHSYYWLVQSPETLARQYGVEMWSDRHWELIGKSFDLMRQVGTRIIYVPMFRQSHLGNEHTMVRWIRDEKAPGGYRHEFAVFEKYLDLALKRLGKLDVVCLHCWPISTGGCYFDPAKAKATEAKPIRITVVDPASGKIEEAEGPAWGQPESREFWKAALGGARERLAARGLAGAMMVGISHDHVPGKACVEDLRYAAPEAQWVAHCHPYVRDVHGVPVGYLGNVWGMPTAPLPEDGRNHGWTDRSFWTTFPRYGSGVIGTLHNGSPPAEYRGSLTGAICAGYKDGATKTMLKGYGWIGADFWPVSSTPGGRKYLLLDAYPYDQRHNLGIPASVTCMLRPGKAGPIATVRLEAARQNLQEVEVRVFLEKILGDPARRAKVGEDLAKRCQDLLDAQISAVVWGKNDWDLMLGYDWERLSGELYRLAAEVAGKLGGK